MAAKKVKLSDVARDLHIPTQELITFFMERDANGVKKKGVTGLTTEEINLALEYYSQKSQVENFDGYFATKNAPKQKQDKKPCPFCFHIVPSLDYGYGRMRGCPAILRLTISYFKIKVNM